MSWQAPTAPELMDVVNATWPAARQIRSGPFMLRDGQNGGKRASAATLERADFSDTDIKRAEQKMRALGQPSLFIIRSGDTGLDNRLKTLGYRDFDYVTIFTAPIGLLATSDNTNMIALPSPAPLAAMAEIWQAGGLGAARVDVMRRVKDPKIFYLGRLNELPAGAAFVAIHNNIAMIHALEVLNLARRQGLGLQLMIAAANWAQQHGAHSFGLVVVSKNTAACGLYRKLGMAETGNYHYRIKDKS